MLETNRLKLYAASQEQMEKFIASQSVDVLKAAYTEMLEGCLSHSDQWEWYAIWMIELKDGTHIGELCFKGVSEEGTTEIGYGIAENYQGCGYATEALAALVDWAFHQPEIKCVLAETEEANIASQKVLSKAGFLPTGESGAEGPLFAKYVGEENSQFSKPTEEDPHFVKHKITIRPEEHKDYKDIVSLILRSFQEGTDYSDGTDIIALVEEIRDSQYYIPELSFVAELDGKVVGHFLFSHFPLSPAKEGGFKEDGTSEIVMLAPVSVHADYFRKGIGSTMIKLGIEKVKEKGYKGITVEGNYKFYNEVGFRTSSEFGIFPTSGYPMEEPRCMMCQETYEGSLDGIHGYIVYDMYFNA